MRLFIVRHAESYSNTQGRMMSSTDLSLTDKGKKQASITGKYIDKIMFPYKWSYVFSSPLVRAKQTAEIITGKMIDIVETEYLKEMNLGRLEGLTWQERRELYPHIDMDNSLSKSCFPDGEKYVEIENRCKLFIEQHLTACESASFVLVVTHGITCRVLINTLLNKPSDCVNYIDWSDNTSITEIEINLKINEGKVMRFNDRQHLTEHSLGTTDYEQWGLFSKVDYTTLQAFSEQRPKN